MSQSGFMLTDTRWAITDEDNHMRMQIGVLNSSIAFFEN